MFDLLSVYNLYLYFDVLDFHFSFFENRFDDVHIVHFRVFDAECSNFELYILELFDFRTCMCRFRSGCILSEFRVYCSI